VELAAGVIIGKDFSSGAESCVAVNVGIRVGVGRRVFVISGSKVLVGLADSVWAIAVSIIAFEGVHPKSKYAKIKRRNNIFRFIFALQDKFRAGITLP
jgi:hypothetical protein